MPGTTPQYRGRMTPPERSAGAGRGYWVVATGAVAATAGLSLAGSSAFERFLGPVPPIAVAATAAGLGAVSLRALARHGWLPSSKTPSRRRLRRGLAWAAGTAVPLAAAAIAFDTRIPFPRDTNVPWPESVLYYPAIGFVAEVAFHLGPLAALLSALRWRLDPDADDWRVWCAAGTVATTEAVFQTIAALSGADQRVAIFVAPHLLAIGFVELVILRRFGFVPMAAFRLVYYALWHVAWGHARLELLFGACG